MPYDHEEIAAVKQQATAGLLAIPGVNLVGLGSKEVDGRPTGELAIKVFVTEKRPAAQVAPGELIPAEIDGVPTDVVVGGTNIRPLSDDPGVPPRGALVHHNDGDAYVPDSELDQKTYRKPLIGGGMLTSEHSPGHGTLGCLLWDPANHNVGYALTNQHVIDDNGQRTVLPGVTKVGQPSGDTKVSGCCEDFIGVYAGGGMTEDRDEALVRLKPGMRWQARITDIGFILGSYVVTTLEAQSGTYVVRKRGMRTKLTGGFITALFATGHQIENQMVIRPNGNPDAGPTDVVFFAARGDSGSVLVNDDFKVVGLVDARDDEGNGFAFRIDHVLSRLASIEHINVQVATANGPDDIHTVPSSTATVAVPPELADAMGERLRVPVGRPWFEDGPSPGQALARLRDDLEETPAGRLLTTLWPAHQEELAGLVDSDRRVMIAWHRGGGAALFQLLLRMLDRPEQTVPDTLYGEPLQECVDRLYETFTASASEPLRADLERARAALPAPARLTGLTYAQLISTLDQEAGVRHG